MRADLSRDTFDPHHQYAGVVLQQGRVLLDADFNEQADISRARDITSALDTIGRVGVPRSGGGFEIGSWLDISPGRIWVDGVPVDNDPEQTMATATTTTALALSTTTLDGRPLETGQRLDVLTQPAVTLAVAGVAGAVVTVAAQHGAAIGTTVAVRRRPTIAVQPFAFPAGQGAAGPARYVAMLRARILDAGPVDDPSMAESALGGPDTSVRRLTTWQVQLERIGAAGTGRCTDWAPPARVGRLRPVLDEPDAGTGDCALPADAAFQGADNSLYRVEVNGVDPTTGRITSLLWDRDNASLVSLVTDVGPTCTLATFGPDTVHSFGGNQTVTISDAHRDRAGRPLQVCRTSDPQAASRKLTLSPSPADIDPDARPRLRRWSGELTDIAPGAEVQLELGLSVIIDNPSVGDYWLIPARTALGGRGGLDWPRDPDAYRALAPNGPEEHWAALALVDHDGTNVTGVTDCRREFPPLTAITANDVSYDPAASALTSNTVQDAIDELARRSAGGCTITVSAAADWPTQLVIPAGGDARVCFQAGQFNTARRVTLRGTGHLVLEGVGGGSVLRATADEVALLLEGWATVTVRDLAFVGGTSAGRVDGLNGALTVIGSIQVRIESVVAACASSTSPRATCLTITPADPLHMPPIAAGVTGPTRATVRDCTLVTGEYQIGMLIRDWDQTDVSGVMVTPLVEQTFTDLNNLPAVLRRRLKPLILHGISAASAPPDSGPAPSGAAQRALAAAIQRPLSARFAGTSTKVILAGPVTFRSPGPIAQAWRNLLIDQPAPEDPAEARKHLVALANSVLRPSAGAHLRPIRDILNGMLANRQTVLAQGIVVAGARVGTVTIENCSVARALQAIHVAASQQEKVMGTPMSMQRVTVRNCTVEVLVPPESARSRHGIFIGNTRAALVADNTLTLTNQAINDRVPSDGIRVWGVFGNDVVVRDNHSSGFPVGIRVVADPRSVGGNVVRWQIRGNLTDGAKTPPVIHIDGNGNRLRVLDNVPSA